MSSRTPRSVANAGITHLEPKMWGASIVGFGRYPYRNSAGKGNEWPVIGFSPRKTDLTLYIMRGFEEWTGLMAKLGKFKTGKSCFYIRKLEDVDLEVLKRLCAESVKSMDSARVRP